jgi:hypothetical protein
LSFNVAAGGYQSFAIGGSDKLTLDTSGNLGLGVTPSAWVSSSKALQIGATGALWQSTSGFTFLSDNAYVDSGAVNRYITTNFSTLYRQQSGQHNWFTAPSGTAGNAITFTQAMTLDASGKLQLNTTSTAGGYFTINTLAQAGIDIYRSDVDANYNCIRLRNSSNATTYGSLGFDSTGLRLDGDAGTMYFSTSGTERARIDSSANLLVGTTSSSVSTSGFALQPNGGGSGSSQFVIGHASGTSSGNGFSFFQYAGTAIGSITQSGTTAVLYNVTSDQRLKENIVDAESASALIDAIQVRQFDWKSDGSHTRYGFVAQELVTVAPEAVHQPADPEEMMAVDYSKLVPMLVKEIQSLRKRLADAGI